MRTPGDRRAYSGPARRALDFTDPLGLLTPVDVASRCAAAGLSRPIRVRFAGSRGRCALYELGFADGSAKALWIELIPGVLGDGLARERDAIAGFEGPTLAIEDLRAHRGRSTAIRPLTGGASGLEWVGEHAADWPEPARVLGAAVQALHATEVPAFDLGLGRPSWREEWLAYAEALARRAVETGVDLGPHGRRLLSAIEAGSSALDGACRWTRVHGNPGPQALEIGRGGPWVIGWDGSGAGDPLVDVAALLGVEPEPLGAVLAAFDPGRVRGWLEPDALRRIEVYHWTWCLAQLVSVGLGYAFDRRLIRLAHLGEMRRHGRAALEPGFCEERLRAAGDGGLGSYGAPEPDPLEALLHVGLGRLAAGPPLARPERWTAGLAAVLLAGDLELADPAATGWAITGREAFGEERVGELVLDEPIVDRERWRREWLSGAEPSGAGLALAWLGLVALDRVEGDASDATLRGLERAVRGAGGSGSREPAVALSEAVVALGAIHGLRDALGSQELLEGALGDHRASLTAAVSALGGATLADDGRWDPAIAAAVHQRPADPGRRLLRPLLALALRALRGREPLVPDPEWVFWHAGSGSSLGKPEVG